MQSTNWQNITDKIIQDTEKLILFKTTSYVKANNDYDASRLSSQFVNTYSGRDGTPLRSFTGDRFVIRKNGLVSHYLNAARTISGPLVALESSPIGTFRFSDFNDKKIPGVRAHEGVYDVIPISLNSLENGSSLRKFAKVAFDYDTVNDFGRLTSKRNGKSPLVRILTPTQKSIDYLFNKCGCEEIIVPGMFKGDRTSMVFVAGYFTSELLDIENNKSA